jgi:hypothetical protein
VHSSLSTNGYDLPFTLTYLFENEETRARLACATGIRTNHPAAPSTLEIDSRNAVWPIYDLLRQKGPIVVENLAEHFDTVPTGAWEKPPARAMLVPITRQGQTVPAGVLITGLNPYRQLDAGYSGFIDLVAGQMPPALPTPVPTTKNANAPRLWPRLIAPKLLFSAT